jgi:hypothetical protein
LADETNATELYNTALQAQSTADLTNASSLLNQANDANSAYTSASDAAASASSAYVDASNADSSAAAVYSAAQSTADLTDAVSLSAAADSANSAYTSASDAADSANSAYTSAAAASAAANSAYSRALAAAADIRSYNEFLRSQVAAAEELDRAAKSANADYQAVLLQRSSVDSAYNLYDEALLSVNFDLNAKVSVPYVIDLPTQSIGEIYVGGIGDFIGLSAFDQQAVQNLSSLDEALDYVAKLKTANVVFSYRGDIYIFGDLLDNNVLNANDLLIKIVGSTRVNEILGFLNR